MRTRKGRGGKEGVKTGTAPLPLLHVRQTPDGRTVAKNQRIRAIEQATAAYPTGSTSWRDSVGGVLQDGL